MRLLFEKVWTERHQAWVQAESLEEAKQLLEADDRVRWDDDDEGEDGADVELVAVEDMGGQVWWKMEFTSAEARKEHEG